MENTQGRVQSQVCGLSLSYAAPMCLLLPFPYHVYLYGCCFSVSYLFARVTENFCRKRQADKTFVFSNFSRIPIWAWVWEIFLWRVWQFGAWFLTSTAVPFALGFMLD